MKTFLITGAGRGLGWEFSKQLLEQGHEVLAAVRNVNKNPELLHLEQKSDGRLRVFPLDVSKTESCRKLAEILAQAQVKKIDVLINNAGIYCEDGGFLEANEDEYRRCFETNVFGPMRVTRSLYPLLKKSPSPQVVHITSKMGSIADNTSGGHYAYRMSKAALNMFNKSFVIDFPEITSVVVHPGWVSTDMGGPSAPVTPRTSVQAMIEQIRKLSLKDSGSFFDFKGEAISW